MKTQKYIFTGMLTAFVLATALGPVLAEQVYYPANETQTQQLTVATAEVRMVSDRSVTLYWQANTESQGEYRYARTRDQLTQQSWSTAGVLNGSQSGHMNGSGVTVGPLDSSTMYYVELRKTMTTGSNTVYGPSTVISFTTLSSQGTSDQQQQLTVSTAEARTITGTSAMLYWQAGTNSIGQYRYATSSAALTLKDWQQTATNGSSTGNSYGSMVALADLQVGTTYYVEVRKILENMTAIVGPSRIISFTTTGDPLSSLRTGSLVKSYASPDVFWVDSARCLHWIVNEGAAFAHFGGTWTQNIFSYTEIPGPHAFCETLSTYNAPGTGDSDGDGLSDLEEVRYQTASTSRDTDNDGLSDQEEVNTYGTNPLKADTDGDGFSDIIEIRNGYNATGAGMAN